MQEILLSETTVAVRPEYLFLYLRTMSFYKKRKREIFLLFFQESLSRNYLKFNIWDPPEPKRRKQTQKIDVLIVLNSRDASCSQVNQNMKKRMKYLKKCMFMTCLK